MYADRALEVIEGAIQSGICVRQTDLSIRMDSDRSVSTSIPDRCSDMTSSPEVFSLKF